MTPINLGEKAINSESVEIESLPISNHVNRTFDHCFYLTRISNGDIVPVGGDSIFSENLNIGVTVNVEAFQGFFARVKDFIEKLDLSIGEKWLKENNIEIDVKLWAHLFSFTKIYEKYYSDASSKREKRRDLYKKQPISLSDIFVAQSVECAEISTLAKMYFQEVGVDSSYFSGDVIWDKEHEFSEAHSFILLKSGDKFVIFDPTNPVNTTSGFMPSVYLTSVDFLQEMKKGIKKFISLSNLISKKTAYFGQNNGTNVWPEKDFI